jgi:hypothetical protein
MFNTVKRRIVLLTTIAMALAIGLGVAWAANPHFVGKTKASLDGANAKICWKEAGLGDNQNINYEASGQATATYVCVNNGGNCPNAANKTTVNGPVSTPATIASDKNGSISACLTISPPSAGSFTCPGGQTLTLSQVTYTSLQIADLTNGVSSPANPSTLAATPFTCP